MKKLYLINCILLCTLTVFTSCQKEVDLTLEEETPAGGDKRLTGTWKFIELRATTEVVDELLQDGFGPMKTVMASEYTTENNTGTVVIDDKKMISRNVAYDISVTATAKMYEDGELIHTIDFPFNISSPPASSAAPYRVKGDSLYFDEGSMIQIEGYGMEKAEPAACHYQLKNNQLILTGKVSRIAAESGPGYRQTQITRATTITVLGK